MCVYKIISYIHIHGATSPYHCRMQQNNNILHNFRHLASPTATR